ncbi:AAA family ATPase [Microbacterium sp. SCN 69-37]|uniref:AAA family ATPase n=1 Tax=Microbacterium sp. SCN 69-37 TaxID=1660115 RepID=UPI00086D4B8E|nr:AAA family ATPase [Microbacterium sp. SCN 69-37]ODT25919.1 MAG: hypothetical protein ABS64_00020 [Microbacterium sp. SCN 69-37]
MRGGLERWKRGAGSQGVRQAMAYALKGSCDSHLRAVTGVDALAGYSGVGGGGVQRFTVADGGVTVDMLDAEELRRWVDGHDPITDEQRGRELTLPTADLILDGTINAPKSYSIAALLHPDLAAEFEALQDRLRHTIITTWQRELNARRGAGGRIRESLHRIEVVELQHRRSRALDPHIHRHLWLNVKVQGRDGKWSNVDSRVAMKLHTLINAEGELAARTDPQWLRALAAHGYRLDDKGEIAELASLVRPLSRRSTQIETHRARLLAEWRETHPGQEPDHAVLQQIDRRAWATGRPQKPSDLEEGEWEKRIRVEIAEVAGDVLGDRAPAEMAPVPIGALDRDLLAARAIVDADARSTGCGGRFSAYDVRAGATRAIAASGIVSDRAHLQELIEDVTARARQLTVDLLTDDGERPQHVKAYMAASTAAIKVDLAQRLETLTHEGIRFDSDDIANIGNLLLARDERLDDGQIEAAAAIAGSDRLVSVTGPAGTGKTTLLRVVRIALKQQGRGMIVVAPTKKAATVAGREIGATAISLHALLADHGWRWGRDAAGAETWSRLAAGETDASTGRVYAGPRLYPLRPGDRIVVDEAGMVDLHTANALAALAQESGAGIAMVGDHLQAMPVGHAGAMACLTRRATAVVELTAVHRFHDPTYAELTLRMREPASVDDAARVAGELEGRGLIQRVVDADAARAAMVSAYFRWAGDGKRVALVTSTNDEATAINEQIQERRVQRGQLDPRRVAAGQGEQRLLEGDVVQTRLNDRGLGVENRALWTVRRIRPDEVELVSLTDSGDVRHVSRDYVAEHVHLAYASTVHGIQGETTDAAVVGPGVDAAGLYVGMTRGRLRNEAIAIARDAASAREQIADNMMRNRMEVSLDDSRGAARIELGRAARPALSVAAAAWSDRSRRPFGAQPNIDIIAARAERQATKAAEEIRRLRADGAPSTRDVQVRLRELSADYAHRIEVRDAAIAEQHLRAALPPEIRVGEDRARAALAEVDRPFRGAATTSAISRF